MAQPAQPIRKRFRISLDVHVTLNPEPPLEPDGEYTEQEIAFQRSLIRAATRDPEILRKIMKGHALEVLDEAMGILDALGEREEWNADAEYRLLEPTLDQLDRAAHRFFQDAYFDGVLLDNIGYYDDVFEVRLAEVDFAEVDDCEE